jgi:signal transduction histidine kinase
MAALLYAAIATISLLHYLTPTTYMWLHPLYARAYYVPLLLIALFWGWRAGLLGAAAATVLYTPHVIHAWAGEHEEYMVSQLIEMAMFFVFATTAGMLADHERKQRQKIENAATQLALTNRQLQESFVQLRRSERLSALGELSAGLAHEIRNPLGSFEGALRIVSRSELPNDTRQEFCSMALSETERLKDLVSNFLDFARPPASHPSPTSPVQLLESVQRLISDSARLAGVTVHIDAQTGLPEVVLDSQQIKQVLLNLALNSVQAMPGGGNLTLRASVRPGVVAFEVEDQGIGIPEDNLEKIFDPFFTTRPNGTGLGLSIAKRIVTQQGGWILTGKNPSRGMTFSVEFPLGKASPYDMGSSVLPDRAATTPGVSMASSQ